MRKVPAVTLDITDDGTTYTVTATPWPTIESLGQPYTARLVHSVREPYGDRYLNFPTKWTPDRLAAFVKKLMSTYPKAQA